ncbi:hypothetical protein AKJ16_DCAP09742 [Drosera capensis]
MLFSPSFCLKLATTNETVAAVFLLLLRQLLFDHRQRRRPAANRPRPSRTGDELEEFGDRRDRTRSDIA